MANTTKRKSSVSKPLQSEGDVKAFWDSQAREHGSSALATAPDPHYRNLEIECVLRAMSAMKHETILDVGCGNGFTTRAIAERFPEAEITGVDFSEAMIDAAKEAGGMNIEYHVADVLALSRNKALLGRQYDVVLSSRCLINLPNWEEQKIGILEMRKMLELDGHMILVENVQDGLDNLNHIRASVGLEPIKTRWHNRYLVQEEVGRFFTHIKGQLLTTEYAENIGNLYYLASRVIYAKICKDQGVEPDYNNPINQVASQLPTMGEHYACSPNFMFVLKNEGAPWDTKKTFS